MFKFFKGDPNSHIFVFKNGKIIRHGKGIDVWFMPMVSSLSVIPVTSVEARFIFSETTGSFQPVAIQGNLTYRLTDPEKLVELLNYTITPKDRSYISEDPEKLVQRIINTVQSHLRSFVNQLPLEQALTQIGKLSQDVLLSIATDTALKNWGIAVESLHFTSVSAEPEIKKALEASFREQLLREADQAIYARRAAAVEEERNLSERELQTSIELENRKQELVEMQAQNQITLAEGDAKAEELRLKVYESLPSEALLGLALKEWAGNAGNLENLSISPDLLGTIGGWMKKSNGHAKQA